MKKLMKVFGIILLVVIAVVAALVIKGLIESKKASVKPDYYKDFISPAPLEQKYSHVGAYEVANADFPSENKASLLSLVEAEYGEFDLENHTIDVKVKLVPKLISEDMKVQVSINGRNIELSRTGNNFVAAM